MKKLGVLLMLFTLPFLLTACDPSKPLFVINPTRERQVTVKEKKPTTQEITGNLFDLLNMGATLMCTYNSFEGNHELNGIAYINGTDARVELTTTRENDESFTAYSITYSGETHFWYSDKEEGLKFDLVDIARSSTTGVADVNDPNNDTSGGENEAAVEKTTNYYKKEFDFVCNPWKADKTKFSIPDNIKFADAEKLSLQLLEKLKGQCQLCNDLPTKDAKEACLYTLECL